MTTVLVVGCGYQAFREYLLAGAARAADVLLIDRAPITWQSSHVRAGRQADFDRHEQVLETACALAGGTPIDGVLTWDERLVVRAAQLAESLAVPSMPVSAAVACRDKANQRAAFARCGVPAAQHHLVADVDEARDAAARLEFPVIVKPRSLAASVGVRLVCSDAELVNAMEFVLKADADSDSAYRGFGSGALVEQYLRGPEISVDSWVLDGTVCPFVVATKRLGFPPYFVEIGHAVGDVLEPTLAAQVRAVVTAANRALLVDRCVTHTELILTANGPKVVEVNGRLGGDLIPFLGELSTPGLSAGGIAAAVAAGRAPPSLPLPAQAAGVHFVYPSADIRFERLVVPDWLAAQPWLREVKSLGSPGQSMRVPPAAFLERAGYCVVTGPDVSTVSRRLDVIAADVRAVGVMDEDCHLR